MTTTLNQVEGYTAEATQKHVDVEGQIVNYHEAGSGSPLVMVDGGELGTSAWLSYSATFPFLADQFRCLAVDLGVSKLGGSRRRAELLLAFLDALGIDKACVLGSARGGQIAMVFAYSYPDRVDKLVWGSAHIGEGDGYAGEYEFTVEPEIGALFAEQVKNDPVPEAMRRYLQIALRDPSLVTDEIVDYLLTRYHAHETGVTADSASTSHIEGVASIKAPTLMIWGRHDRVANFEIAINAVNHIANSRFVVLQCGHWPPYELTREFSAHVADFLTGSWA
jgi:2-hydroxy-6-oxonona-2,4-dienedioate hydrolase